MWYSFPFRHMAHVLNHSDFYSVLQWDATQPRLYTVTKTIYIHLPPDLLLPAYWTVHGRLIMEKATQWLIHSETHCLHLPTLPSKSWHAIIHSPFVAVMRLLPWTRPSLRNGSWKFTQNTYRKKSPTTKGYFLKLHFKKWLLGSLPFFCYKKKQKSLPFLV